MNRTTPFIALGGGVTGDIAGFAAATFMRGVPFIQVPTTLLSMTDSSVGGKTGVDLQEGKNLVGSFYQPKLVWIDLSTLKTLSLRQLKNGLAEVIKYGIIKDGKFFKYLAKHSAKLLVPSFCEYENIVYRCCKIKAEVVKEDEKEEKGVREILNLGHTFGHAIETLGGYKKYLHGEGVAIGMNMAAELSLKLKMISKQDKKNIEKIIKNTGLPLYVKKNFAFDKMLDVMSKDKKVKAGKMRLVLPQGIGNAVVLDTVSSKDISEVLKC